MVKPLRDNAVGNNGRQLTGGALTCVVMATLRRVASLPNRHNWQKGRMQPLYRTDLDSTPYNRKVEFDAPSNIAYGHSLQ